MATKNRFAKFMGWHSEATAKCFADALASAGPIGAEQLRVAMQRPDYTPEMMLEMAVRQMRNTDVCRKNGVTVAEVAERYPSSVEWAEIPEGTAFLSAVIDAAEREK